MENTKTTIAFRIALASIVILYIIIASAKFDFVDNNEASRGIKTQNEETFAGIIHVWNITGFKPYSGSFASILNCAGSDIEKEYFGIYFEVKSMSLEEYSKRVANGERPDVISFSCGMCYEEQLMPLGTLSDGWAKNAGKVRDIEYAVAYAASGYIIAVNKDRCDEQQFKLNEQVTFENVCVEGELAGNITQAAINGAELAITQIEEFVTGKKMFAICDMGTAGDIVRQNVSKGSFEMKAYQLSGYTDEIQLVGITKNIDEAKIKYASAFIVKLLEPSIQRKLINQGLFSINKSEVNANDAPAFLKNVFLNKPKLYAPNTFLFRKHQAPIEAAAERAILGDDAAKNDLRIRVLELVEE